MKQFSETHYASLLQKIEMIEEEPDPSPALQRIRILDLLHQAMDELKTQVLEKGFESLEEEVNFFKHQKPKYASLLIYHSLVDRLELLKPEGTKEDLRLFYENELGYIRRFFNHHQAFYQYVRSEATHLDDQLFTRGQRGAAGWIRHLQLDADARFSTAADALVARIRAHEQLKHLLLFRISQLENPGLVPDPSEIKKRPQLRWTGDAINLVEIAYGWYCTGQLNHGQAGIAEIVRWLEDQLQISIGRPYRRFTEIKRRKLLSQTRYLDQMREGIMKKLDEEDAFDPHK